MKSQCPFKTVALFVPKKNEPAKEIEFMYPPKLKTIRIPFYNHVLVDFDYVDTRVFQDKIVHFFREVNCG